MFVLFCIVFCSILLFVEWQAPSMGLYVSFVLDIVHLGILLIST
jgi:hypothetical protein